MNLIEIFSTTTTPSRKFPFRISRRVELNPETGMVSIFGWRAGPRGGGVYCVPYFSRLEWDLITTRIREHLENVGADRFLKALEQSDAEKDNLQM